MPTMVGSIVTRRPHATEIDRAGNHSQPFIGPQPAYITFVENRTEPKTAVQWVRYVVVAVIALFLVWWMLRVYVL